MKCRVAATAVVGVLVLVSTASAATKLQKKVAGDEKEVADARAALERASFDLNTGVNQKTNAFETSAEHKAALKAVADAQDEQKAARSAVLAKLKGNANYSSLVARENAAQAHIDSLKAANADSATISAATQEAARLGGSVSTLEHDALEGDATYKTANEKLLAANAALVKMKDDFAQLIVNDPNLTSLRRAKENAETKLSDAEAKLRSDGSLLKH